MTVSELNKICKSTLISHLGIKFLHADEKQIIARMPVDDRTVQPQGILHGGASLALAETVGSAGSFLLVDREKYYVVGLAINASHVKSVSSGYIMATANIVHKGERTHVWEIKITNENNDLICVSRITNMIVKILNREQ